MAKHKTLGLGQTVALHLQFTQSFHDDIIADATGTYHGAATAKQALEKVFLGLIVFGFEQIEYVLVATTCGKLFTRFLCINRTAHQAGAATYAARALSKAFLHSRIIRKPRHSVPLGDV